MVLLYIIIDCTALFFKHTIYKVVLYRIYTLLKYAIKKPIIPGEILENNIGKMYTVKSSNGWLCHKSIHIYFHVGV